MLLYIHVPFCRQKCSYCSFYSVPLQPHKRENFLFEGTTFIESYVTNVCSEIGMWCNLIEKQKVTSIFFGGGTPSLLSAKSVERLLKTIDSSFLTPDQIEITIEANPESAIKNSWLKDIHSLGINRISFGVQSFFDEELQMLGRAHTVQDAEEAIEKARSAGFSNINLDLMWGLPKAINCPEIPMSPQNKKGKLGYLGDNSVSALQSLNRWLSVLKHAVSLYPEHISAYALTIEKNTPLFFFP